MPTLFGHVGVGEEMSYAWIGQDHVVEGVDHPSNPFFSAESFVKRRLCHSGHPPFYRLWCATAPYDTIFGRLEV